MRIEPFEGAIILKDFSGEELIAFLNSRGYKLNTIHCPMKIIPGKHSLISFVTEHSSMTMMEEMILYAELEDERLRIVSITDGTVGTFDLNYSF